MKKEKSTKLKLINLLSDENIEIETFEAEHELVDVTSLDHHGWQEKVTSGKIKINIVAYNSKQRDGVNKKKTTPPTRRHFEINKALIYDSESDIIPSAVSLSGIVWVQEPCIEMASLGEWGAVLYNIYFYKNRLSDDKLFQGVYKITFFCKDGGYLMGETRIIDYSNRDGYSIMGSGELKIT
jgi:hypothetical protein